MVPVPFSLGYVVTIVTVDGVMQGLGGADEDRTGGFERGGWVTPAFDNEALALLNQVYQRADPFLFGRRTYEIHPAHRPGGRGAGHAALPRRRSGNGC
jgi:dihydrofolate reductase